MSPIKARNGDKDAIDGATIGGWMVDINKHSILSSDRTGSKSNQPSGGGDNLLIRAMKLFASECLSVLLLITFFPWALPDPSVGHLLSWFIDVNRFCDWKWEGKDAPPLCHGGTINQQAKQHISVVIVAKSDSAIKPYRLLCSSRRSGGTECWSSWRISISRP